MKLSAPTQPVWLIAIVLGVLGILAQVVPIAALVGYSFWMVAIAFILLAIATMLKGL
jgi:hypothetical protein